MQVRVRRQKFEELTISLSSDTSLQIVRYAGDTVFRSTYFEDGTEGPSGRS